MYIVGLCITSNTTTDTSAQCLRGTDAGNVQWAPQLPGRRGLDGGQNRVHDNKLSTKVGRLRRVSLRPATVKLSGQIQPYSEP